MTLATMSERRCTSPAGTLKSSSSCTCSMSFRLKAVSDQAALNLVHGELDDIGRTALHGMVHRRALAEAALHFVARLQLGNMAFAAEHRSREPAFLRLFNRLVEVGAHARIGLEITVNHILSRFETDSQALGQAERLLAVHDAEVHGLRAAAQLRVTSSTGTSNTRAAVAAWKSAPEQNASIRCSSPDRCASRRSSICE